MAIDYTFVGCDDLAIEHFYPDCPSLRQSVDIFNLSVSSVESFYQDISIHSTVTHPSFFRLMSLLIEINEYKTTIDVYPFAVTSEPSIVESEQFKRSLDFMLFDMFTIYRKDKKKEPIQMALI